MKDNELLAAMLAAAMLGNEKNKAPEQEKSIRERSKEIGELMNEIMLGFMDAGFTKEQAFQIALAVKGGK